MSTADLAPPFELRPEPALGGAFALSFGMHLLLLGVLLLGVNWQIREPEPVVVELWRAPSPAPVSEIAPPAPPPAPAPEPEPVIPKPDIALKAPQKAKLPPKPEPRVERKTEPKVVAKAPPAPPRDPAQEQRLKEQLAREQASINSQRQEEELRLLLARQQADGAAARSKRLAGWTDKISAKIKGNILLPQDLIGNPEAIFDVVQIPSGEVIGVKLRKSSGHRAYDEAVERAILKSSPLPKPDDARDFQRQLELKFRPRD